MMVAHLTKERGSKKTSGIARRFYFLYAALLFITLPFCFSLSSCTTTAARLTPLEQSAYIPAHFSWTKICDGIGYCYCTFPALPLRYHGVSIALDKVVLTAYPDTATVFEKKASVPESFPGKKTGAFAKESGATVAINTTPYAGKNGSSSLLSRLLPARTLVGTHRLRGTELGTASSRYCALVFTETEAQLTARIIDSQTEAELFCADYAFGGFWTILRNGNVREFKPIHTSRTACGISADGTTLYLLVVEGEHPAKSIGLSFSECAEVLKAMGSQSAMEFDGGTSSELCINGKSVMSYSIRQRNGASLGFKVK
ncbi:MAG: phosphodiester glycosidase family protein [Treponema sp.]|nr:phosphodiester glycosidase family protein [Treponema sp.]